MNQSSGLNEKASQSKKPSGPSFMDHVENSIKAVNDHQKLADKAATDLATGKKQNIHETMLTASQAEITFNLMVQMRNKALEAYQEVMRMPV
ncbi:MAG: flagellar hook-basal body complex protein FliE [Pseudobacteriovorax sp.]|nr:flagellar hook-basal body complex protein FliE [Pseudobacteriovorax sp.]